MQLTSGSILSGPLGPIATRVYVAETFVARLRGVIGRAPLSSDEALIIRPCEQIHTFGVPYELDVVFCDVDLGVLHVETVPPGRVSRRVDDAHLCVELLGGRAAQAGVLPGTSLSLGGTA